MLHALRRDLLGYCLKCFPFPACPRNLGVSLHAREDCCIGVAPRQARCPFNSNGVVTAAEFEGTYLNLTVPADARARRHLNCVQYVRSERCILRPTRTLRLLGGLRRAVARPAAICLMLISRRLIRMSVGVNAVERGVLHISVQVQRLWVAELGIGNGHTFLNSPWAQP